MECVGGQRAPPLPRELLVGKGVGRGERGRRGTPPPPSHFCVRERECVCVLVVSREQGVLRVVRSISSLVVFVTAATLLHCYTSLAPLHTLTVLL